MAKEENVRFLVTVPKSLHEKAKKAAEKEQRNLSNWVCVMIGEKLKEDSK